MDKEEPPIPKSRDINQFQIDVLEGDGDDKENEEQSDIMVNMDNLRNFDKWLSDNTGTF